MLNKADQYKIILMLEEATTDGSESIRTIDLAHQKVHEESFFTHSDLFANVPATETRRTRIVATTESLHIAIQVETAAKAYWRTYGVGNTYTDDGTLVGTFNRVVGSDRASTAQVYINPVVDTYGANRGNRLIPAGTGGNASGGSGGTRIESVIPPGHELLIEVENKDSQQRDISITLDWYEVFMA